MLKWLSSCLIHRSVCHAQSWLVLFRWCGEKHTNWGKSKFMFPLLHQLSPARGWGTGWSRKRERTLTFLRQDSGQCKYQSGHTQTCQQQEDCACPKPWASWQSGTSLFSLVFGSYTVHLSVLFFLFILLGVCWTLWICKLMTFTLMGKFICSGLFFFLSLREPSNRAVLILSYRSLRSSHFVQ